MRRNIFLVLIFCLGLFLRLYRLPEVPVGLHGDEVSIGYNAFSLLKTARDQDGNFLPLFFDQFGNFRAPGYQYIDVPFVAIFGLNALGVRLPAALFGAFSVLVFYLLLSVLFERKSIALIGSFLLAINPWHINISRATSEAVIASFFVLLGAYFLYKAIKEATWSWRTFAFSFISFLVSFFFYHAAGPFVLVFVPVLFLLAFLSKRPSKAQILWSIGFSFIVALGLVLFLTAAKGTGRASQVGLISIPGGTKELIQSMDEDGIQNPLITRFYHNKLYFYSRLFLTFFSEHLSGEFLFVNNGEPVRYRIHWNGNLYLVQLPFLVFGFSILLVEGIKKKKYSYLIAPLWLFIGILPAALTWEDLPNVLRANLMIPALMMISAFGFYEVLTMFKGNARTVFIVVISFFVFQNSMVFMHSYFYHAKVHEPWFRSAAEDELVFTVQDLLKEYEEVIMTTERNNNLIFHLFYLKFDPGEFQRLGSPREIDNLTFQNMTFRYGACPIKQYDPKVDERLSRVAFIVKSSECDIPETEWEKIKTISTPDGSPAFYVLTYKGIQL